MLEIEGNIFDFQPDYIVIPINLTLNNKSEAVMGAGLALEAKKRWPTLPKNIAASIKNYKENPKDSRLVTYHGTKDGSIVAFPTKFKPQYSSCLNLILKGVKDLAHDFNGGGLKCYLPRLGCGCGGLDWSTQVKPLIAPILNDNFIVVSPIYLK